MEFDKMTIEELQARKAEIAVELDGENVDLDALEAEIRSINNELETRKAAETKRAEIRKAVAAGEGTLLQKKDDTKETNHMTIEELRNSPAYIEKYADYIKTGDDTEIRAALLTENVNGAIAVPDFVYDIIKTSWEKSDILSRVSKTYVKGNLKVNFEIDGDLAVKHTEGSGAVDEENLTEGIVTLVPAYFKKWKSFSDEVMSLRGEAFIRYIYDEITHRIIKAIEKDLLDQIKALPAAATATQPAVAVLEAAAGVGTVAQAIGLLSDEATDPVIVMNKQTWSYFKSVQYAAHYAVDLFEGLPIIFNNQLAVYNPDAETSSTYMIVGDFGEGALANFPNGEDVEFVFDEISRKKEDLVEVLGKLYGAVGVVAMNAFVQVKNPA